MQSGIRERLHFLNKFLHAPRQYGSVTPSSHWLAQTLLDPVPWNQVHSMAELGAGTGAITRFIPRGEKTGMNVFLFEIDPDFRRQLREEFPDVSATTIVSGCVLRFITAVWRSWIVS